MALNMDQIEAARRRMLSAQAELKTYEEELSSSPPDRKRFNRLFARARTCTDEYLALMEHYLREKYAQNNVRNRSA